MILTGSAKARTFEWLYDDNSLSAIVLYRFSKVCDAFEALLNQIATNLMEGLSSHALLDFAHAFHQVVRPSLLNGGGDFCYFRVDVSFYL